MPPSAPCADRSSAARITTDRAHWRRAGRGPLLHFCESARLIGVDAHACLRRAIDAALTTPVRQPARRLAADRLNSTRLLLAVAQGRATARTYSCRPIDSEADRNRARLRLVVGGVDGDDGDGPFFEVEVDFRCGLADHDPSQLAVHVDVVANQRRWREVVGRRTSSSPAGTRRCPSRRCSRAASAVSNRSGSHRRRGHEQRVAHRRQVALAVACANGECVGRRLIDRDHGPSAPSRWRSWGSDLPAS